MVVIKATNLYDFWTIFNYCCLIEIEDLVVYSNSVIDFASCCFGIFENELSVLIQSITIFDLIN